MRRRRARTSSTVIVVLLLLCLLTQTGQAVPSEPVPVPTLSEWGTIILVSLLAIYAVFRLRRQQSAPDLG